MGIGRPRVLDPFNQMMLKFGKLTVKGKKPRRFSRKAAELELKRLELQEKELEIQKEAEEKALEDPIESLGKVAEALDTIIESDDDKKMAKLAPILRGVLRDHEADLRSYLDDKEVSNAVQDNDDEEESLEAIADLLESFGAAQEDANANSVGKITDLAFDILLDLLDALQKGEAPEARPAAAAPKKNAFSMKSLFNALNDL